MGDVVIMSMHSESIPILDFAGTDTARKLVLDDMPVRASVCCMTKFSIKRLAQKLPDLSALW